VFSRPYLTRFDTVDAVNLKRASSRVCELDFLERRGSHCTQQRGSVDEVNKVCCARQNADDRKYALRRVSYVNFDGGQLMYMCDDV
jgi:hypothetical protein